MARPSIRTLFNQVTDAGLQCIYPRNCVGCGEAVNSRRYHYICETCERELFLIEPPCCETCGYPFHGVIKSSRSCPKCVDLKPFFKSGRSLMLRRSLGLSLVHQFKYERRALFLMRDFEQILVRHPGIRAFLAGAAFIPVPLHRRRLCERGYNQSLVLARGFARALGGIPVLQALKKTVNTPSQTHLSRTERKQNLQNAFALRAKVVLNPRQKYIIIDDVLTSGETLNACCRVLARAGIKDLRVLTLAHS